MPKTTTQTLTIKRPFAVTAMTLLHLIFGTVFFIFAALVLIYSIIDIETVKSFMKDLNLEFYTPPLLILTLFTTAAFGLSSGIGMFMGKKWGWHIGGFYYAYNIFRNVNSLFFIQYPIKVLPLEAVTSYINDPNLYYVKHGVRGAVFLSLYLILNLKQIRQYFKLSLENNLAILLIELVIMTILTAIVSAYFL